MPRKRNPPKQPKSSTTKKSKPGSEFKTIKERLQDTATMSSSSRPQQGIPTSEEMTNSFDRLKHTLHQKTAPSADTTPSPPLTHIPREPFCFGPMGLFLTPKAVDEAACAGLKELGLDMTLEEYFSLPEKTFTELHKRVMATKSHEELLGGIGEKIRQCKWPVQYQDAGGALKANEFASGPVDDDVWGDHYEDSLDWEDMLTF
ncbi:hypothetical protein BJ508DRAFT_307020 [Ascobolus immersus RN42]|uniref:Uncharacterized protein n=1 Tax=Ascobolus immersus RN42 TaxID=1160509 RepID=A0A3N4I3X6_ASCIM|nr:hypothetical protein BJ508DRAFT_307020 [Ascobolus immersus RN42]